MRMDRSAVIAAVALVVSAASARAEDENPVRTFTPQLPMTAVAQPLDVTPSASNDGDFPTGTITDTQNLALPMAKDDDEQ